MTHGTVTMDMLYKKLEYLQKKVDEIETILLLPEEKLSQSEINELKETREQMLLHGGISLEDLARKRRAR